METVQSPGHAWNFEKLPKFQRLVLQDGGLGSGRNRHDLLLRRQELPTSDDANGRGNPYNKGALHHSPAHDVKERGSAAAWDA